MNPKDFQPLIEQFLERGFYFVIASVLSVVAVLVLKQFANSLVNWRNVKSSDIGIGAMFVVDGDVWVLDRIAFTFIELRCVTKRSISNIPNLKDYGMVMRVPLERWNKNPMIILYPSGKALMSGKDQV